VQTAAKAVAQPHQPEVRFVEEPSAEVPQLSGVAAQAADAAQEPTWEVEEEWFDEPEPESGSEVDEREEDPFPFDFE
jgi:hypothetical protein